MTVDNFVISQRPSHGVAGERRWRASARPCIEPDCVRLEVAAAARAPDSEVVVERLKLLAAAIGVRRSEIVVVEEKS